MDTPFMDIAKSETLRGFTELTLFYMSGLDDTSFFFLFFTLFVQSSFTQCSPNLFVCVLVIERSAKISFEKASQVLEEKELDKRSAVKSCQAGGEGEWSRVNLHEACTGVQVPTGTRTPWDAHQTFFVRKSGEGGRGPSKFFGNTDFKKLRKIRTTP